jgi:hypothetical protein
MPGSDGTTAFKATCVRLLFSAEAKADDNSVKSTDRIKRARGFGRYMKVEHQDAVGFDLDNPNTHLMIGDPYATLVKTKGGVCLVIFSLLRSEGCDSTGIVHIDQLDHPNLMLLGKVMEIQATGDWTKRLKPHGVVKTPGSFITPVNPDLRGSTYSFDVPGLSVITADLWQRLKPQQTKLPVLGAYEPFHPELFVAETIPRNESAERAAPKMHQCSVCTARCEGDAMP